MSNFSLHWSSTILRHSQWNVRNSNSIELNRLLSSINVPVNSKTAHPPPRAIPGHLTRVKLRTVGNLTQNETRPVGHLYTCQLSHLKAQVNEDTLLRTYCCPWCFLGCANWETFVAGTKCFWTKSKTFLCLGHKICVCNKCCAHGQTGKHLCWQQCVLVCQGL